MNTAKKIQKGKTNYVIPGKAMTKKEFIEWAKDAEESGTMSFEEFSGKLNTAIRKLKPKK